MVGGLEEDEIAYVAYYPHGSTSSVARRRWPPIRRLAAVAGKHGVSPSQIALAWLLAHYDRMLLIPARARSRTSRGTSRSATSSWTMTTSRRSTTPPRSVAWARTLPRLADVPRDVRNAVR